LVSEVISYVSVNPDVPFCKDALNDLNKIFPQIGFDDKYVAWWCD